MKARTWLVWLLAFVAICSRRQDCITQAQFYAEDGTRFFFEAGLHSLLQPVGGYLNVGPRIAAWALSPLPWAWLPLLYALAAAWLVAGAACRIWTAALPAPARVVGALACIAVPSAGEPLLNLCCLHCMLVPLMVVELLSPRRGSAAVLALVALSGPECLVLVPIACGAWWRYRGAGPVVLVLCALTQGVSMAGARSGALHWPPPPLAGLYSNALFGLPWVVVAALAAIAGWRGPSWRTALALASTACLLLVAGRAVAPGWPNPYGGGCRYAWAPFVLAVWACGFLALGPRRWAAWVLCAGAGLMAAQHWVGRAPPDYGWVQQVRAAEAGTLHQFTIPGAGRWTFPVPR